MDRVVWPVVGCLAHMRHCPHAQQMRHCPTQGRALKAPARGASVIRQWHRAELPKMLQGLALNAPALGRQTTTMDHVVLSVVGYLAHVCPKTPVVPGTPWEELSDEPDLIERMMADELYSNGDIRAMTALTLGQVCFCAADARGEPSVCAVLRLHCHAQSIAVSRVSALRVHILLELTAACPL
jgi:hypothetical protein